MNSSASSFEIGEICSSEEDTKGGASLSSTMIEDDEERKLVMISATRLSPSRVQHSTASPSSTTLVLLSHNPIFQTLVEKKTDMKTKTDEEKQKTDEEKPNTDTNIQLVQTCLVLNWDQDKKIEKACASFVEIRTNGLIRDFLRIELL
ncbi:hypothetical protein Tco_0146574 [Tanacetum coccineum]